MFKRTVCADRIRFCTLNNQNLYFVYCTMDPVKCDSRVFVETFDSEVYEGNVANIYKHGFSIYNTRILDTSTQSFIEYRGSVCFCWEEIRKFTLIGDKSFSDEAKGLNSEKIMLPPDEFDRLKEMTTQFIFIDNFGKEFTDAIEVLSNREYVAVAGLGNIFRGDVPLNLLLMSDFKQIYIFDIVYLIHLKDLKLILESKSIRKVVHGGETLFDCLYHDYHLEMVNVFDTQVVDSMMSKTENNVEVTRNLPECLNYHFNFPSDLLAGVMDAMNDKTLQNKRPLAVAYMSQASHLVAYLLTLKDHFVKKILKPYSEATAELYSAY